MLQKLKLLLWVQPAEPKAESRKQSLKSKLGLELITWRYQLAGSMRG